MSMKMKFVFIGYCETNFKPRIETANKQMKNKSTQHTKKTTLTKPMTNTLQCMYVSLKTVD